MMMDVQGTVVELPKLQVGMYEGDHLVKTFEVSDPRERICALWSDDRFTVRPLTHVGSDATSDV